VTFVKLGKYMHKRIVIVQFLFFLSFYAYAFEYANNLSLGVFGMGISPTKKNPGAFFFGHVINFNYQSTSGFGVNISPLHFSWYDEAFRTFSLTFINTSFFYDFLKDEHLVLGPFGSLSAIKHNCPVFFELHGGITFLIRNINFYDPDFYKDSIFGLDFLVIELGYKYNNKGQYGFYANLGMDLLTLTYAHFATQKKDEIEKYQKEHPVY
jgi:hypothetical protein